MDNKTKLVALKNIILVAAMKTCYWSATSQGLPAMKFPGLRLIFERYCTTHAPDVTIRDGEKPYSMALFIKLC